MVSLSGLGRTAMAFAAFGVISSAVMAADYPERDVTLVVQSSAGGGSDIFARTVSKELGDLKLVDRTLLVENRPGGSGAVAYSYTAKHKGDPYILQTTASSFFTTPLLGQSPVGPADFTPVAAIAQDPYVLAVNANSKYKTLADLIAAKSISAGTTGVVNDQTILAALLTKGSGLEIRSVPFDGDGDVMSAVLGGHIDAIFGNPSEILQQIESKDLRPLAVSTDTRLEALPDVPTFKELGYDIVHTQLRAIVMPKDVPDEALKYWQTRLEKLASSDEWKKNYVEKYNLQSAYVAGDDLKALFNKTTDAFREQMKAAGLIK